MSKKLSPAFAELTQDALLKAFWFKPSLRLFLQQHSISDKALAQWHSDQSKRDFVGWLWPRLLRDEKGQNAILGMARSLAEMRHFPDLERKEDTKIRIPEAQQAIARLRQAVQTVNETIRETADAARRRKKAQDEIASRLAAQQSLEKLQGRLTEIIPQLGTREGGYAFERWLYDLAVFFELEARPGYVASGRQIDGALTFEGTTFITEAKFTENPVESPDIDIFMAKIESKADNTMGLLRPFPVYGWSDPLRFEATHSNVIARSQPPLQPRPAGIMTLPQLISRIKRHASQTGSSYLAVSDF